MKLNEISYLCRLISNLTGIPIRLFENQEQILYYSIVSLPKDPLLPYVDKVTAIHDHIGYYMTEDFFCFGIVNSVPYSFVIGPTRDIIPTRQELRKYAYIMELASSDAELFVSALSSIPWLPLNTVLQILFSINFALNKEQFELKDFLIMDQQQNHLSKKMKQEDFWNSKPEMPHDLTHNTLSVEQKITRFIEKGDYDGFQEWATVAPSLRTGILSETHQRNLKNTFIVVATLSSRAAIRGGLDSNEALSLSDNYIRKCESLSDAEEITNLQYHMIVNFILSVQHLHFDSGDSSKLIINVKNYVRQHLFEHITTQDIANSLYISREYLSSSFKKRTGINLSSYIRKEKIEEAKRLLVQTDNSILNISSYLGFSSHGHFSQTFLRETGMTPSVYRNSHSQ